MRATYLNNAAAGWPKAPGVAEAVIRAMESPSEEAGRTSSPEPDQIWQCRTRVARLLAVEDPSRIVFTLNATHALNTALLGVGLGPGCRVVTTVTEHNSVLRPLERLRRTRGVEVEPIAVDPDGILDEGAFDAALRREPHLVALNHVSNVTGMSLGVKGLFARARAAGAVTLLDASQSIGHLEFTAADTNADLIAFNGYKGLHGPDGTGVLYVRPGIELDPTLVGGTGVRSDLAGQPPEMPTRLEAGTPNTAGLAGLGAALEWFAGHGGEYRRREREMADHLRAGLADTPGIRLFGGEDGRGGVVSFQFRSWSVEEAGHALQESFGVVCRTGLHCAPLVHQAIGSAGEGTVRFSVSGFTDEEDIVAAVTAVRRMSECGS